MLSFCFSSRRHGTWTRLWFASCVLFHLLLCVQCTNPCATFLDGGPSSLSAMGVVGNEVLMITEDKILSFPKEKLTMHRDKVGLDGYKGNNMEDLNKRVKTTQQLNLKYNENWPAFFFVDDSGYKWVIKMSLNKNKLVLFKLYPLNEVPRYENKPEEKSFDRDQVVMMTSYRDGLALGFTWNSSTRLCHYSSLERNGANWIMKREEHIKLCIIMKTQDIPRTSFLYNDDIVFAYDDHLKVIHNVAEYGKEDSTMNLAEGNYYKWSEFMTCEPNYEWYFYGGIALLVLVAVILVTWLYYRKYYRKYDEEESEHEKKSPRSRRSPKVDHHYKGRSALFSNYSSADS